MENYWKIGCNWKPSCYFEFIIILALSLLMLYSVRCVAQETFQTVTSAGSTTNQRIAIGNAIEQDVIATPSNSYSNNYVSQYAYTTVNGATSNIAGYMLLQTQGAYWYNGYSGLGFYNAGAWSRPVMEVISGNYGNFAAYLPANCAIRNNFLYQFIAGTTNYSASTDNLITAANSEVLFGVADNRKFYINKGLMIGTTTSDANSMLQVNGNIAARKLTITQTGWPDYVFDSTYHLPALSNIETFIKKNHHLPDIPSAKEIKTKGLDVGSIEGRQMRKIEELMLYQINSDKKIKLLQTELNKYKKELSQMKKEIEQLKGNLK